MTEPVRKLAPLQGIKGMNDILPPESERWEWFEGVVRELMRRHGYANVRTPIVEPTALFVRGIGEVTDIVEKEMYSFEDAMNGDRLTLRPENTAGVVRAVTEHSFLRDGGKRLFYIGPMFRHERPQKGRYRQFHQVGAEAMGYPGPDVDAELILMVRALWRELGLVVGDHVRLEINSLGQADERSAHRRALIAHFEAHLDALDDEARARLHRNPLRLLDSKHPPMQAVIESAPRLIDHLGDESLAHLAGVRAILDAAGLEYRINPRLVRGLDYYNLTVFEWVTDRLGSQNTVCGGGRYDPLIERLGGKPAPAVGWGMGIERVLLLLKELAIEAPARAPTVYAVVPRAEASAAATRACDTLRAAGVSVVMHAAGADGWGSMKSQLRRADASGARYALIFGDDELARGEVALKALREPDAEQRTLPLADIARWGAELGTA
ncbi:histidine--tRNA ligase [Piscinibacter koreensis]|uniref:Histidine--tRNA ligase n=1 Tax=Piscinibacter koreensis TaxID=2742824 RepID=A0A7Y6NN10_9BURK|nr:histidine--tRNA ligase [Schlegelella koreensis]NUZ06193.1 histidine--tRNA ligase [Schlegelella koreensis]